MSDEVSLPAAPSYAATIEEIRDWSQRLHQWLAVREPLADGDVLDKFLTGRNAVSLGLASLSLGSTTVGNSSSGLVPGFGTYSPSDVTQPDSIANLTVTPGVSYFFVEFDAPTYRQGGGNGRTVIYSATYSGAGPLPTFANAVEVYQCFGAANIAIVSAEPGAVLHFWAKAESRAGILQATATGGTNGVSATCGPIDGGTAMIADFSIMDAKIVSLSVAKLLAGSIDVGEYIQSTGYVPGTSGWRIHGDGTAEFSGVIIRGTLIVGTTPAVSGTTMTGSGAIFNSAGTWAAGNATTNISFNGTTLTLNGNVVATGNINANAVTDTLVATEAGPIDSYDSLPAAEVDLIDLSVGPYDIATDVVLAFSGSVEYMADGDLTGPPTPGGLPLTYEVGNATDGWTEVPYGDWWEFDGKTAGVGTVIRYELPASTTRTYVVRASYSITDQVPAGNEGLTEWTALVLTATVLKR